MEVKDKRTDKKEEKPIRMTVSQLKHVWKQMAARGEWVHADVKRAVANLKARDVVEITPHGIKKVG